MSSIVKGRAGNSRVVGDCVNEVANTARMRVGDVCYYMNCEITIKRTSTFWFSVNGVKVRGVNARDRLVEKLVRNIKKARKEATRASVGAENEEDVIIVISEDEQ
jgi:hypothetical protein